MKKFLLISTLTTTMTMPLVNLVGCNNAPCSLKIATQYCFVEGAKDSYKVNDKVSLKFTPWPLFKLPSKEDLIIGGADSIDWNQETGELHFKILTNAAISVNASCGGHQIGWWDAKHWIEDRKAKKGVTFTKVHCSYSCSGFSRTDDKRTWETIKTAIEYLTTKVIDDFSGEFIVDTPFTYPESLAPSLKWIPKYPENMFFANDNEIFILAGKAQPIKDVYLPLNLHYNNDLVPLEACWSYKNISIPLIPETEEEEEIEFSKPINFDFDATYEFKY